MLKTISKNKPPRVVVAMSGGVDSSVAAYLLKKQGYDVIGIFLKLWEPDYDVGCNVGEPLCGLPKKGSQIGPPPRTKKQNLCCDDKAMAVARQIANKLKIPFYVLRVDKLFKKEIVDNFLSEYEKGRTPNPCVRCNKYIKFGYLWEKARQLKADYLATGHYIRVAEILNNKLQITNKFQIPNDKKSKNKNFGNCDLGFICDLELGACDFNLMRSKDEKKDQTYFLSSIDLKIIPHLLFPLGDLTKKEVREIAKKAKLPVYNKKDSMGVCFIPDGNTNVFLKHFSKKLKKPGEIVDKCGNVIGKHAGLMGYTVGQRIGNNILAAKYVKSQNPKSQITNPKQISNPKYQKRKKIPAQLDVPRLYVLAIDSAKNRLIVGENEDCFSREMVVENVNILDHRFWDLVKKKKVFLAQIRGGHKSEKCAVSIVGEALCGRPEKGAHAGAPLRELKIEFLKPVRAITPGQTAALCDKNVLIGGGVIKNSKKII